jgi:hypothetical protein
VVGVVVETSYKLTPPEHRDAENPLAGMLCRKGVHVIGHVNIVFGGRDDDVSLERWLELFGFCNLGIDLGNGQLGGRPITLSLALDA